MLCALLILSLSAAGAELYAHPRLGAHPPLYALRSELPEDAILVANNRIRVPLGRSVSVDPVDDLVVQTRRPGDRCSLTVLDDDPLARRPGGRLSPEKFPCNFGPGDVTYTHYGARSPALDRVRLQLRYDARAETVVIPFVMEVQVDLTPLEVLTKNLPLTVTRLRGTSDAVDGEILDFTYDREGYKCQAMSSAVKSALPRYGRLLDGGKLSQKMDCDQLTRADIRYEHTFRGPSPDRDHIPMVLELRDREGNLVKREHFHLTVQIRQGRENAAPRPSLEATMMMEVSQFAMTALTPEMLAADDAEADPGELAFNVTSPLSYEEGYIVSTDDQNLPITSFYQRDLRDLKIAYKPPSLDADTERIFQLELEAVDPEGAASDPFAFVIVVKPMNSLAPVVTRNAGQLLYEGQSRPLVTGQNLEIGDADDLEAVRIAAVDGLRHGILLVRGSRGDRFTAAELAAGAVAYRHDGSDTHSDNVLFRMTDGKHQVEFLFPITVVPTDDEPPVVSVNAGLVLFKNRMMPVSPLALGAADIDSDDAAVRFTVVSPFSTVGVLLLRQSDAPADPSSWTFNSEDEVYEKEVREWLQKDITEGRLFYKHAGPQNINNPVTDRFVFTLRDDNDPPNESGRATFVIRVLPTDTVPPELHPGATLLMTVEEFQLTPFSKEVLRYTDSDSEDRDLKYTVLRPPTDTDENHPLVFGSLVLTDRPDVKVSEFTQAQVNGREIAYGPPARELGITLHVVRFWYGVEDAAGNRAEGAFTVYLRPIHNKPPQITNAGFAVFEGGAHVVTLAELDAVDADTESQSLTFRLARPPQRGTIRAAFADLPEKATFGLRDLSEGRISYSHGGEGTAGDEFHLDVSDGVHVIGVTVKVHVRPVDDEAPSPSPPDGTVGARVDVLENAPYVGVGVQFSVLEGDKNAIGPQHLNVDDPDTPAEDILCIIDVQPKTGYVENISPAPGSGKSRSGVAISAFTVGDIRAGDIFFVQSVHRGVEPTEDGFSFRCSDGMNFSEELFFPIIIQPTNDEPPEIFLREIVVRAGVSAALDARVANGRDADTPPRGLTFVVSRRPKHGRILNRMPTGSVLVTNFTLEEIREASRIVYQHDGSETTADSFELILTDGKFSARKTATVNIVAVDDESPGMQTDDGAEVEDESSVFFPEAALSVEEDAGHLSVPVHRGGDVSEELTVLCYTRQGSATGTAPTALTSHSDFIARPEEPASVLRFDKGERVKACRVRIIDDSLYEPPESFDVTLASPAGGRLGPRYPSARVTILEDQDDAPVFYFGHEDYRPGESDAFVDVKVLRAGGDLSKAGAVTVRSGQDDAAFSRDLDFAAGVSALTLRLNIPDDLGRPRPEGAQTFDLLLLVPVNGILGEPAKATITVQYAASKRAGRERVAQVEVLSDSAAERTEAFTHGNMVGIGSGDARGTNIIRDVALDRFEQPSATGSISRSSPDGAEAGEPMGDERVDSAAAAAEALLGVLLLVLTGGILMLASRSRAKCDIGRERRRRDDGWETVKGSLSSEPILVVRMQRRHDGYVV